MLQQFQIRHLTLQKNRMKMRKSICFCVIVYFASLVMLFAMAAEEQEFRNELEAQSSESGVSYEKYQRDLAKLLEPPPKWEVNLKYIFLTLGAIALGVVAIFFIKQIRQNLITEAHTEESETAPEHVETEKAALARAETAVESNDFRGALRYLYLSAILHLQERGILPYDKSLTNREYLHQSQVDTDLQTTLGPAISVFDEVWYGHKPCDAETVASYRELLQKVYGK